MSTVEVRCPVGPQKLFTKLKLGEEFSRYIPDTNGIEFSCSDCARRVSKERERRVRVFHEFSFIGELYKTTVEEL